MCELKLVKFATRDRDTFERALDRYTQRLMAALPKRGVTWGLARKLLNIFLRDSLYTTYLNKAYGLSASESLLEIPLDSITSKRLRKAAAELPRWRGVRHLDPQVSAAYQATALRVAKRKRTARVHLDAYWWGVRQ
jgi:hypothetical protein